jgi:hypothetical protein
MSRTVNHRGNLAGNSHTARCILGELALASFCYDYFRHFVSRFLVSGTIRIRAAPFVGESGCQYSVVSYRSPV